MRNIILKEKVIEFLNKACIYTATLLVAVLVFIAFGFDTHVNAADVLADHAEHQQDDACQQIGRELTTVIMP